MDSIFVVAFFTITMVVGDDLQHRDSHFPQQSDVLQQYSHALQQYFVQQHFDLYILVLSSPFAGRKFK